MLGHLRLQFSGFGAARAAPMAPKGTEPAALALSALAMAAAARVQPASTAGAKSSPAVASISSGGSAANRPHHREGGMEANTASVQTARLPRPGGGFDGTPSRCHDLSISSGG